MSREYFKGEFQESLGYSKGVKVSGGTTVYLSGVGAIVDSQGKSLAGNLAAQARSCFEQMGQILSEAGGTLDDIVTMTVFVTDIRYLHEFVEIRKEYFKKGFPASALIGVDSLARPEMLIEILATAVLDR
jgi:2-iminobutanoate/2-iminopropanoate deaminase